MTTKTTQKRVKRDIYLTQAQWNTIEKHGQKLFGAVSMAEATRSIIVFALTELQARELRELEAQATFTTYKLKELELEASKGGAL